VVKPDHKVITIDSSQEFVAATKKTPVSKKTHASKKENRTIISK
jgi:hypothetical protein